MKVKTCLFDNKWLHYITNEIRLLLIGRTCHTHGWCKAKKTGAKWPFNNKTTVQAWETKKKYHRFLRWNVGIMLKWTCEGSEWSWKLWSIIKHSFLRLFAHSEDPDIDEPFQQPVGHVLGESESNVVELILLLFIVPQLSRLCLKALW